MSKKYTLTEEQFIMLTSYALQLRNAHINALASSEKENSNHLSNYHQNEIDEINATFDSINAKFKTNF